MFVTSDIFDLGAIAHFRELDWRENLMVGVDVHGLIWPGHQAAARFMLKSAELLNLVEDMRWAGYGPTNEGRFRNISPKSFERLAGGDLKGAKDAVSVLLRGEREAHGTHNGDVVFGGEMGACRYRRSPTGPILLPGPPWRFRGDFLFPLGDEVPGIAGELISLAVDVLGAEYGYMFVRDELCGPTGYAHGMTAPLDYKPLSTADATEISNWSDYVREGRLWSERAWFRDLFQVNLLSERHTRTPVEVLGLLPDWIAAEAGRGRIEPLNAGRWLWTLTDAEMVAVRPQLNEAGLLVSCRPRVYRDLPGGGGGRLI
jgi:hypothetical protein